MNKTNVKTKTKNSTDKKQFSAQVNKVLNLVINSLYTNHDIFLRELISNASDACDKARYQMVSGKAVSGETSEFKINIIIDSKDKIIEIVDNGIGMSKNEMIENLGTIAKSGTEEFINKISSEKDSKKGEQANLIGQFGIGFYSSFMVADKVEVISKKAGEKDSFIWRSDCGDGFEIGKFEGEHKAGSIVRLFLKGDAEEYLDEHKIKFIVETYSSHVGFPICLIFDKGDKGQINKGSAIWSRSKSDITDEEYKEFYRHVSHNADDAWLTMHNKTEGKIEYTSLLFIPSTRPFDLYNPERRRRIKLYVRKVFITEESIDVIPHYLRFVFGVVDSEDLPLNVSRETLQDNVILSRIKQSITKKILTELDKKSKKDSKSYIQFWDNFGSALKEGLCEATAPHKDILKICRFYNSEGDGNSRISLDDYLEKMPEDQENIFFITGDNIENMKNNPQLEGFKDKGIDVLLLNDHVDDFWVGVCGDYNGKKFKSVTRTSDDLDKFSDKDNKDKKSNNEKEENSEDINNLIEVMKSGLSQYVKDVRVTKKLKDSPVCLAIGDADMEMRMEKFLVEHKQLPKTSSRILEINPNHGIINAMAKKIVSNKSFDAIKDVSMLLLDQARIVQGDEVPDPVSFARRMNKLIEVDCE